MLRYVILTLLYIRRSILIILPYLFRFTGNKVIAIVSSSNVKKGDELFYCYGKKCLSSWFCTE